MTDWYVERTLSGVLGRAMKRFPAVVVSGPRQSGKTTLVRRQFEGSHRYLSLDDPLTRELALEDPTLFLERFERPLILDEIQYAPQLLRAIKLDIDEHRQDAGRFLLTGSQVFSLMHGVGESLAGRIATLSLLALSLGEQLGHPDADLDPFSEITRGSETKASLSPLDNATRMLVGGYPEISLTQDMKSHEVRLWHGSYIQTYLERDVRTLKGVADLRDFQRFVLSLAARSGGLMNASELGRDTGVSNHTVKDWTSVLEASGQIVTLLPFHTNLGKRVTKRPKVFFLDTGTLSYLLRTRSAEQLLEGPTAGQVFETAVLGQVIRRFAHRGERPPVYFWRTSDGQEVDLILDYGDQWIAIEAKLTATPTSRHAKTIHRFQQIAGERAGKGYVACLCREAFPLSRTVDAIPLSWI